MAQMSTLVLIMTLTMTFGQVLKYSHCVLVRAFCYCPSSMKCCCPSRHILRAALSDMVMKDRRVIRELGREGTGERGRGEREREIYIYTQQEKVAYMAREIYIYTYTHTKTYISRGRRRWATSLRRV